MATDLEWQVAEAAEREIMDFLAEWLAHGGTGPVYPDALVGEDEERTLGDAIREAVTGKK